MAVTWDRLLALLIAIGYCVAGAQLSPRPAGGVVMLAVLLAVPLVLIWYPEIGSRWPQKKTILGADEEARRPNWRDSPPGVVAFMGWFLLVGLPLILYLISRSNPG
jgi:hypothetical protein